MSRRLGGVAVQCVTKFGREVWEPAIGRNGKFWPTLKIVTLASGEGVTFPKARQNVLNSLGIAERTS